MSQLTIAIVAGIALVIVDGACHIVCDKYDPLSSGCRVALFLLGFMLSFVPISILIGLGLPQIAFLILFGMFTGFSNSLSIDVKRAYLRKRMGG